MISEEHLCEVCKEQPGDKVNIVDSRENPKTRRECYICKKCRVLIHKIRYQHIIDHEKKNHIFEMQHDDLEDFEDLEQMELIKNGQLERY
jgi:hypothetical protein